MAVKRRVLDKLREEPRLIPRRCPGAPSVAAPARPSNFADNQPLVWKGLAQLGKPLRYKPNGVLDRNPFPVGKQVHGNEVDMGREVRMSKPHVPGLKRYSPEHPTPPSPDRAGT